LHLVGFTIELYVSFENNERNTTGNPSKGFKATCFGRNKLQSMYNSVTLPVNMYKTLNNSNYKVVQIWPGL